MKEPRTKKDRERERERRNHLGVASGRRARSSRGAAGQKAGVGLTGSRVMMRNVI